MDRIGIKKTVDRSGERPIADQMPVWSPYDRPTQVFRRVVLVLFAVFIALPLIGMVYFTFRSSTGGFTTEHWTTVFSPRGSDIWDSLGPGLYNSLILVVCTVVIVYVLVIPAIILIDVRFPRMRRMMRVFMLFPIAVPAIILVVGFAPVFAFLSRVVGPGSWTLSLAYGVLAMPFVYTTVESDLSGLHAGTLVQAAESLGSRWSRTLVLVLVPCLRRSIVSATLMVCAIVLGEFTVASLLNRETLQTDLIVISQGDVYVSVIITLIVLVGTFAALFAVSGAGGRRTRGDCVK